MESKFGNLDCARLLARQDNIHLLKLIYSLGSSSCRHTNYFWGFYFGLTVNRSLQSFLGLLILGGQAVVQRVNLVLVVDLTVVDEILTLVLERLRLYGDRFMILGHLSAEHQYYN